MAGFGLGLGLGLISTGGGGLGRRLRIAATREQEVCPPVILSVKEVQQKFRH